MAGGHDSLQLARGSPEALLEEVEAELVDLCKDARVELWTRVLSESVQPGGGRSFSRFHMMCKDKQIQIDGDWKAIRIKMGKTQLYNLAADLGEQNDLADKQPAIRKKMEQLFETARTESAQFPLVRASRKKA